jgi:UDP-N-acetylmuramoylalanine--D-glutamate ligase
VVAETGGVTFVNDSKATNAASAARALAAFPRIRWICGGLEKEGGLEALAPHLSHVVRAYVIGREAQGFALKLPGIEAEVCTTMARAVARAVEDARPGETVLLAPAAGSFDQYDSFERRGEDFVAEVRHRLGQG